MRGGAALAGAGLLALLLAGGARGQDYGDYDYGDYDDDPGFTPEAFTPEVETDPTEYVPLGERPGFGTIENPRVSDLANQVGINFFRETVLGISREKPQPLEQLISFLDRAIPAAEETRTGFESALSGLSTVQGSLELIGQEFDQADKNARKGKLYREGKGGKGGKDGEGSRSPEEERELCGACVDSDTTGQCLFWAQAGQCAANPIYMLRACAASCCAAGAKPACKLEPATFGTTREIRPPAPLLPGRPGAGGGRGGQRTTRGRQQQQRGALGGGAADGMPAEMVEELARLSAPAWIGERGLCLDLRSECPSWARQGLCMQRPEYMAEFCPRSCLMCQ